MKEHGWGNLVEAIHRIWSGERDIERLSPALDDEDRLVVGAILRGIEDPGSVQALLPDSDAPE